MKGTSPNKPIRAHALVRLAILLVFTGGFVRLAAFADLRSAVPELVGISAILTLLLALILYLDQKGKIFHSPALIWIMAAGFRLLFVFHSPQLSDDIHRYLFDGQRLLSCHNPYALAPAKVSMPSDGMALLAGKVNHPDLVTIYPPGAQLVFAGGALLGGITGMKFLFIGLDLGLIALIMRILSFLKLPANRAILYAWHPVTVLEISASGHIDGAGLFFFFLALCLLIPGPAENKPKHPASFFSCGLLFSAAILVKLFPVVFFPGLWRLIPGYGRKWFLMGLFTASLLSIVPFAPDIQNSLVTLKRYSGTWEFAGFLFRFLRQLFDSGHVARVLLGVTFVVLMGWIYYHPSSLNHEPSSPWTPWIAMLKSSYAISLCFLLLTPTLHPWYTLYLLSFLPFYPGVAGITLSWSVLLGYRILISYGLLNQWVEDDLSPLMIWGGPIAALILLRWCHWGRLQPAAERAEG